MTERAQEIGVRVEQLAALVNVLSNGLTETPIEQVSVVLDILAEHISEVADAVGELED